MSCVLVIPERDQPTSSDTTEAERTIEQFAESILNGTYVHNVLTYVHEEPSL